MGKIKNYIKIIIPLTIILGLIISLSCLFLSIIKNDFINDYQYSIIRNENMLKYNEIESNLVDDVNAYIDSIAPSSNLNGYTIVRLSLKYNLDICFVLAQGQIESHFGTVGLALKTNSIFNVGAYDSILCKDINGVFKYKHPDFSVEPYMKLLYKDYITKGKTELNLLNKYVNKYGKRYASDKSYEVKLSSLYSDIKNNTKIYIKQRELNKYAITLGL